jgi:hypothetical protein
VWCGGVRIVERAALRAGPCGQREKVLSQTAAALSNVGELHRLVCIEPDSVNHGKRGRSWRMASRLSMTHGVHGRPHQSASMRFCGPRSTSAS